MLDKLLSLRPTNAVARLGGKSLLPLLNPRDLLRALERHPTSLVTLPVVHPALIAPLLRAAREVDAVVGFSVLPGRERERVGKVVDALRDAAAETGHQRPVFVQAGPFSLGEGAGSALEVARGDVYRAVDGGATLIVLDPSGMDPQTAGNPCAEVAASAIERELSLEVVAPGSPEELRRLLDGMRAYGAGALLVRLSSGALQGEVTDGGGETPIDFGLLEQWKEAARAYDARLSVEDLGSPLRALPSWTAAQVAKVEVGGALARVISGALGAGDGQSLRELADAPQAIDALDRRTLERLEARLFAEAQDVLEQLGAPRSASRSTRYLAEHAGY